ncbi:MauE/DoxX family redox-associated membrane protein [Mucilaginibacter sp. UC70_90]
MKRTHIPDLAAVLLIFLFVYTASSKLLDFDQFRVQMLRQAVPHWMAQVLIYGLPGTEFLISALLIVPKTRLWGFYVAFTLMALFTGYAGLVLAGYFDHVPCSCGGVLKNMGWTTHFVFNLFFLLLTVMSIYITYRERRRSGN